MSKKKKALIPRKLTRMRAKEKGGFFHEEKKGARVCLKEKGNELFPGGEDRSLTVRPPVEEIEGRTARSGKKRVMRRDMEISLSSTR